MFCFSLCEVMVPNIRKCRFLTGLDCSLWDSPNTNIRSAQDAVPYPRQRAMKGPTWALLCTGTPAFTGDADSSCWWVCRRLLEDKPEQESQGPESPHYCHLGRLSTWSWLTMGTPPKAGDKLSSGWSRHRLWMQKFQCKLDTLWPCILRAAQLKIAKHVAFENCSIGFWRGVAMQTMQNMGLLSSMAQRLPQNEGVFEHHCT